jgi:hypothetical protein
MTSEVVGCEKPTREDVLAIEAYMVAKRNSKLSFVPLSELAKEN